MAGVLPLLLITACLSLLGGCQRKAEVPKDMGPLTPFLDIGKSGVWTGQIKDGVYSLSNATEPRALRTITLLRTDEPKYSVSVDIAFASKTDGMAGLVFAHTGVKQYYLLALRRNGEVVLYERTPSSLTKALDTQARLKPGFNRLSFDGEGNTITIHVNGHKVATEVAQGLGQGGAGIAALGVGTFSFTRFAATGYYRDTQDTGAPGATARQGP